jgi:hypothetical protein
MSTPQPDRLRPSSSRVCALAAAGELEGERDESNDWRFLARAVHTCVSERPPREPDPTEEIRRLCMSARVGSKRDLIARGFMESSVSLAAAQSRD